MTHLEKIVADLPYTIPFKFVDELLHLDENGAVGTYLLREDEYFYQGHFVDQSVTPGVILIEIAAQIGLVCLGLNLSGRPASEILPSFTQAEINFLKPVLPGTKLTVTSEKVYFRFNKLKCKVKMTDADGDVVLDGYLSGFLTPRNKK